MSLIFPSFPGGVITLHTGFTRTVLTIQTLDFQDYVATLPALGECIMCKCGEGGGSGCVFGLVIVSHFSLG